MLPEVKSEEGEGGLENQTSQPFGPDAIDMLSVVESQEVWAWQSGLATLGPDTIDMLPAVESRGGWA